MTKKHFIALADKLRDTRPSMTHHVDETGQGSETPAYQQWVRDRDAIARFCHSQNSAFKWGRWMGYINGDNGPSGGKVRD